MAAFASEELIVVPLGAMADVRKKCPRGKPKKCTNTPGTNKRAERRAKDSDLAVLQDQMRASVR